MKKKTDGSPILICGIVDEHCKQIYMQAIYDSTLLKSNLSQQFQAILSVSATTNVFTTPVSY
jgi:hypothetical protein